MKLISSKTYLWIVSIVLILMGIWGLVPNSPLGTEPEWHAGLKIVFGALGILVAWMDKGK